MLRQGSRKKDVKDICHSRLHLFLFVGFLVDGPKKKYKTTAKYKQDNVHPPAIICMRPATKSWRNALNLPLELPTRSWCYALNLLLELPAGPWCYALNLLLELPVTNVTRIWQIVPCHWRRLGLVFREFLCHRLNLKTLPSHGCCPCPPQDGSLFWAFFLFFLKFHTSRLILSISAILAVLHVKRDEQTKPDMMLKLVKTNEWVHICIRGWVDEWANEWGTRGWTRTHRRSGWKKCLDEKTCFQTNAWQITEWVHREWTPPWMNE